MKGTNFSKHTTNVLICKSPSKSMIKLETQATTIQTANAKIKRLEQDIENNRRNNGVILINEQFNEIFNDDSDDYFNNNLQSKCSKDELCKLLWKNLMKAAIDAKKERKNKCKI